MAELKIHSENEEKYLSAMSQIDQMKTEINELKESLNELKSGVNRRYNPQGRI